MKSDPLAVAFREVAATRYLLESLLTSSETFDYLQAKAALTQLREKVRVLAALQAELSAVRPILPDCVIPFPVKIEPQRGPSL